MLAVMQFKTTCNRDCPDACGILATVEDGRVTKLQGDPDHPVTRGFLCYRTSRFLERQYDPDRLTSPMVRRNGSFAPIPWEEALNLVASKMLEIRESSGPAAILNYRSGGSLGLMKHLVDYFFECFGPVAVKSGDICSGAGDVAQETDFGIEDSNDLFDLLNSRTIVLWGKNPFVSNLHLLPVLREAKKQGARLIMIDPVEHRGAELCDVYLQLRPGGDSALALGVIQRLFDDDGIDPSAGTYCDNLAELEAAARSRNIDGWAELAGVTVEEIETLATAYADGPSAILVGWGMQRRANGSATVRTLDALGAVSGNIGIRGGGVSFYFARRSAFDLSFTRRLETAPRTIPEPLLGPGILEASDPPIRMVWISNGNPVAMLPESETVARALESREFTVVVDAFMTDTALCADLVLPTTTMLEDEDVVGAYGHHFLGNVARVVDPPDGVRTDHEILLELASRVGIDDRFQGDVADWKKRLLSRVAAHGVTPEILRRGACRNPLAPEVVFSDRKFPTATGKINLIREVDPTLATPTPERPLLLMALATEKSQGSQWPARKQAGLATVTVHPDSAAGFGEGESVIVESAIDRIEARLRFDARQRIDVALMDKGGWRMRGRCANRLVAAATTDAGGGACYYDTPIRLLSPERG